MKAALAARHSGAMRSLSAAINRSSSFLLLCEVRASRARVEWTAFMHERRARLLREARRKRKVGIGLEDKPFGAVDAPVDTQITQDECPLGSSNKHRFDHSVFFIGLALRNYFKIR